MTSAVAVVSSGGALVGENMKVLAIIWIGASLLSCIGCSHESFNRQMHRESFFSDRRPESELSSPELGWHSIVCKKELIKECDGESYKLQIDCDRDINEIVRMANAHNNIGRKIVCRIKLEHSELSNTLEVRRDVPCTMTGRHIESYKVPLSDNSIADYPSSVAETWGVGDLRWFALPRRYDVVFALTISCFENKKEAEKAMAIARDGLAYCHGLSIEDNVICNISTQCDYYVCIDVQIITYRGSDQCAMGATESGNGKL